MGAAPSRGGEDNQCGAERTISGQRPLWAESKISGGSDPWVQRAQAVGAATPGGGEDCQWGAATWGRSGQLVGLGLVRTVSVGQRPLGAKRTVSGAGGGGDS